MHTKPVIKGVLGGCLVILFLLAIQIGVINAKTENDMNRLEFVLHPPPGTPTNLKGYRLPFDRNSYSVITNGPYEGMHTGRSREAIDFSPKGGWTDIYAAKAGTVYINRNYADWGNLVIVCHQADGFCTYYAHLQNLGAVGVGSSVSQGQYIGKVGNTGCDDATPTPCGVHLHWEARDGMTPTPNPPATLSPLAAYGGNSTRHSLRRVRGIGWYPWYPEDPNANAGFTIVAASPHKVGQCLNNGDFIALVPAHNQITHSQQEEKSFAITWGQKQFPPPTVVNAGHLANGRYFGVDVEIDQRNYFVHVRTYDATTGQWARDDQVAHQGPYQVGLNCPSSLPPDYKDDIPDPEPED